MGGPAAGSQQPEVAAALTAIDTAASCPICHFLLDTPLLLRSCGHSCELEGMVALCRPHSPFTASAAQKLLPGQCLLASRVLQTAALASAKTWLSKSARGRPPAPRVGEHVENGMPCRANACLPNVMPTPLLATLWLWAPLQQTMRCPRPAAQRYVEGNIGQVRSCPPAAAGGCQGVDTGRTWTGRQ